MKQTYSYPLDFSWSTEEISSVLSFFNQVEAAYEKGVAAQDLLAAYTAFKRIVPSKSQEKQLDKEFFAASGYSTYRTVQLARETGKGVIRLGK